MSGSVNMSQAYRARRKDRNSKTPQVSDHEITGPSEQQRLEGLLAPLIAYNRTDKESVSVVRRRQRHKGCRIRVGRSRRHYRMHLEKSQSLWAVRQAYKGLNIRNIAFGEHSEV